MRSYLKKFKEVWLYYDYHPILLFLGFKLFFFSIQDAFFNDFFTANGYGLWFALSNISILVNVLIPLFMFNNKVLKPLLLFRVIYQTHFLVKVFFLTAHNWSIPLLFNALGWFFETLIWAWVYFRIKREELYKELKA